MNPAGEISDVEHQVAVDRDVAHIELVVVAPAAVVAERGDEVVELLVVVDGCILFGDGATVGLKLCGRRRDEFFVARGIAGDVLVGGRLLEFARG
ncbi:hypothetical protein ACTJKH_13190 [Microbacterium sp. 22215]|uniref:hypothetical protein n=1 Tax=Microbacterium sp. 22215 TaxID=3453893 RepID=UPI003F84DC23